ncbi:MAG: hypothetical protein J0M29_12180 [Chitinophagales bacterium]|nr:hypothetical protein [Chitinophagales bacterium]
MQKSVLLEIIRSLDKKEIRELNKWLQSPAHNQRQDVVRLFEFLVKNLPNGDEAAEKARAWKYVFPGETFDDAYLRQVMYFLLKAIEDYLVFVDLNKDRVQYQLSLSRIYRERKLEKAYRQAYRTGKENLEAQPLRDNYYFRYKFLFEQDFGQLTNVAQNAAANLQETSNALEKWFLAEKLHISYAMLAHKSVYKNVNYQEGMLHEVLTYCEKGTTLEESAIAVYYYAYLALTNPDKEDYFDQLELLIGKLEGHFKMSEFRTLYVAAINYCVPKINQGRLDFSKRAFDLYRKGLESGTLLENGIVSRYTFGNAVGAALRLREYGWAETFIEDFQHHLEEKERNSIVNFNQSRVYFEKGDYTQAQQLLTQFDYDDMLFNPIAKTMLLKIYFETDEYDAFESLLESLRTYLQRKEAMDATRKASYKNMISLMKKLLQLNIFSRAQKETFRELVVKTNPLAERDWFLRQLDRR